MPRPYTPPPPHTTPQVINNVPKQKKQTNKQTNKQKKSIRGIEELRSRRVQLLTLPSPLIMFTISETLTIVLASVLAKFSKDSY